MNEEFPDYGLFASETFLNLVDDHSWPYFLVHGFRRHTADTFVVLSAFTAFDEKTYDLIVFFSRSLCMQIPKFLDDEKIARKLEVFFEASDNEETDFPFEEGIFLNVTARLGEKTVYCGETIVPLIATKVSKSPLAED